MKRTKQLLIKLNEEENSIVQNMRERGINISQFVRMNLTEYARALYLGDGFSMTPSPTGI